MLIPVGSGPWSPARGRESAFVSEHMLSARQASDNTTVHVKELM